MLFVSSAIRDIQGNTQGLQTIATTVNKGYAFVLLLFIIKILKKYYAALD